MLKFFFKKSWINFTQGWMTEERQMEMDAEVVITNPLVGLFG